MNPGISGPGLLEDPVYKFMRDSLLNISHAFTSAEYGHLRQRLPEDVDTPFKSFRHYAGNKVHSQHKQFWEAPFMGPTTHIHQVMHHRHLKGHQSPEAAAVYEQLDDAYKDHAAFTKVQAQPSSPY